MGVLAKVLVFKLFQKYHEYIPWERKIAGMSGLVFWIKHPDTPD